MVSVPETGLYGAFHYLRRPGDCFCDHDADTGGQPDNYSNRTAVPVYDGGN